MKTPDPGGSSHDNILTGVAATSARDAWAAGYYSNGTADQTLLLHWNGSTWKQVKAPNPASPVRRNFLTSIRVTSAGNAWAAGYYFTSATSVQTLVLHWNGTKWKQDKTPNPAGSAATDVNALHGLAATSSANAWAVGSYYQNNGHQHILVLHWNGASWKLVPIPDPGTYTNLLLGIAAASPTDLWAVGQFGGETTAPQALALHCC